MTRRLTVHRMPMPKRFLLALLLLAPSSAGAQVDRPADVLALRRLLEAHEFVRLDSALAARRADARRSLASEARYVYAYDAFDVSDTTLRPHLDAWVAEAPTSPRARLARGGFFMSMAGVARGTRWASETSDDQVARMEAWLHLAAADAAAAKQLDSTDVMAHFVMLNVVRFAGTAADSREVIDRAVALERGNFYLRALHLGTLRPRWGGSAKEIDDFARAAQEHLAENPRLRALLGYTAYDRGDGLYEDDQYQAALAEYTTALSYGDFWRYRVARGWLYLRMHHPEKALVDLNRTIAERPGMAEALAKRAIAYAVLAYPKEGAEGEALMRRGRDDLAMATALDPADDFVVWTREKYPQLIRPATSPATTPP